MDDEGYEPEPELTEAEAFDIGDTLARLLLLLELARDAANDDDRNDLDAIVGALEDVGTTLADLGIVEPNPRFNRWGDWIKRRDVTDDEAE